MSSTRWRWQTFHPTAPCICIYTKYRLQMGWKFMRSESHGFMRAKLQKMQKMFHMTRITMMWIQLLRCSPILASIWNEDHKETSILKWITRKPMLCAVRVRKPIWWLDSHFMHTENTTRIRSLTTRHQVPKSGHKNIYLKKNSLSQ